MKLQIQVSPASQKSNYLNDVPIQNLLLRFLKILHLCLDKFSSTFEAFLFKMFKSHVLYKPSSNVIFSTKSPSFCHQKGEKKKVISSASELPKYFNSSVSLRTFQSSITLILPSTIHTALTFKGVSINTSYRGRAYILVVEHLPSMPEALGLIPCTKKNKYLFQQSKISSSSSKF